MVTHLSLEVTNIVVNGTCIMNLDYIKEVFKSNCFMIPKDLNNTYCFRAMTLKIKLMSNNSL